MSSITAQQTKLDLELIPKEKRLDIGKCNKRLNPGKIQREPTFQVVMDALALTSCYSAFLITADVPEGQDFDALPTNEEIVSFLRDLGHTREIHSLNHVVVDQMHQPWRMFLHSLTEAYLERQLVLTSFDSPEHKFFRGALLPESLTSLEMKETKAYKNYIGFASVKESKEICKEVFSGFRRCVVIRETPKIPLSKKKEKKEELRDFHKTHPSGSSAVKIIPSVASEGTGIKPGVPDVMEEESSERNDQVKDSDYDKTQSNNENESDSEHETNEYGSESDQEEDEDNIEDDEEEEEEEVVKTPSNDSDDEDETKTGDKAEGDKDEEMDYTTRQLYNDVDIRLNKPVDVDKGFVQEGGTDAAMTNKTKVPDTSSFHSSDLTAKFLNFSDIPHTDAEAFTPPPTTKAINPSSTLPDFASVFQFNNRVTTLEKGVAELEKDDL
ncbi:hypothetical protein Tco_1290824 [Tanacetum coccineum]